MIWTLLEWVIYLFIGLGVVMMTIFGLWGLGLALFSWCVNGGQRSSWRGGGQR